MCVPRLFRKVSEPGGWPEISICAHKVLSHALELSVVLLPVPAAGAGRMLCGGTPQASCTSRVLRNHTWVSLCTLLVQFANNIILHTFELLLWS